jgi:1-acyl-sn-glycerol-3-phosphate acyltransferase
VNAFTTTTPPATLFSSPSVRLAHGAGYTLYMCQKAMYRKARGASDEHVRDLTKMWAAGMRARLGVEVRDHGFDAIDWSKSYVLMANHQSYLDVLALFSALPKAFGVVAKKQLFHVPFFSGVMKAIGCISVDRSKHVQAMTAMRTGAEAVRAGATIAIFPEGTRSPGDRVGPLKKGPFVLAQLAQVPLIPIGIRGTHALMPLGNTGIRSGTIDIHAGAPIAPPAAGDAEARQVVAASVRQAIAHLANVPMVD